MRRKLGFASVGIMLLAGVTVAQAPAQAGTAAPNGSATVAEGRATIDGRPSTDADTAAAVGNAYWTPERMRAARPAPLPDGVDAPDGEAADRPSRVGAPRDVAEPAAPRSPAAGLGVAARGTSQATQAVNASPGVGRVFFRHNNEDFFCSGATVNNPQANLVSTAGHCVHPGDGGSVWYDNWAYAPEFTNGVAVHGLWFPKEFTSVEGWVDWGFLWWDFAFVTMHPRGGKRLVHVTGGQGLSVNQSKKLSTLLLGYPAEPPYDGESQYYDQGTTKAAGAQRIKLKDCPLNRGASGGPFLRAWDNDLRFGFVNSVMSYKFSGNMYGPYFDDDVLDIYNVAKNKQ
ncbi:hypothetical protein ACIOBK_26665 [Micromonospora chokoriensis]